MARTITVRKYFKPSLGKEVNHAGYTRKVKDAPERPKYKKPKLAPKPFIDTANGRAYLQRTEYDDEDGNWNANYQITDGFWVIHDGTAHHIYKVRKSMNYSDLEKDEAIREYRAGNKILRIYSDSSPTDPRSLDYADSNIGIMICSHKRYNLGDKQIRDSEFESWEELEKTLKKDENAIAILPLYLYDHSGITIQTTPFGDRWDSGQVGFIYTTKDKLKDRGKVSLEKVKDWLRAEVKTYDQYLTGEVYGFKLFEFDKGNWTETDSCWGFYGEDKENGIFDSVPEADWKEV